MKKTIRQFVCLLCAAVLAMSAPALAASEYKYTKVYDGTGYNSLALDEYLGSATSIVMPYYIDDMPVVSVLDGDVYDRVQSTLKSFVWSPYVSGMRGMFDGFTALESIVLPEGVEYMNSYCFRNCVSLGEINLPSTLKTIQSYDFQNCTSLTHIDLTHIEKIEGYAFDGCTNLTDIKFGNSLKSIGGYVFQGTPITELKLPEGLEKILGYAFSGSNITHLELPDTVTSTTVTTFSGLQNQLQHLRWTAALPASGFRKFTALSSIEIPEGVEEIRERAFQDCTSLSEVDLPESLTTIGKYAFYNTGLTKVYLPSGVTSIGTMAFPDGCILVCASGSATEEAIKKAGYTVETPKSIVTLPAGTTTIEAEAFRNTDAEYVIVPDGCKTIGSKAFANMSSLKYVQLPASIESIADDAFDGCAIVEIITAAE